MKYDIETQEHLLYVDMKEDVGDVHELDDDTSKFTHKKEVRRRLDTCMERRRLKKELEDYEGELGDDFEWDE